MPRPDKEHVCGLLGVFKLADKTSKEKHFRPPVLNLGGYLSLMYKVLYSQMDQASREKEIHQEGGSGGEAERERETDCSGVL